MATLDPTRTVSFLANLEMYRVPDKPFTADASPDPPIVLLAPFFTSAQFICRMPHSPYERQKPHQGTYRHQRQ